MKRAALVISIFILILSNTLTAQQAVYKFTPGKSYKYLMEMKQNSMTEFGGENMATSVDGTVSLIVKVDKTLPDGSMQGGITVENALVQIETPQGTQSVGAALAGKRFGLTILGDGSLKDIDTTVKIDDEASEQMAGQILRFLHKMTGASLTVGSSWTRDTEDTLSTGSDPIVRVVKRAYKVLGTKTEKNFECLEISFETSIKTKGTASMGGQDIFINGENSGKGTLLFAPKEGILVKLTAEDSGEQNRSLPSQSQKATTNTTSSDKIELMTE